MAIRRAAIAGAAGFFCALAATTPGLGADITVDIGAPFKAVDHAASGSLYGLAADGWPQDKWIAAVAPKNFTQMAPGGQQLPNGERQPVGDALVVAPIAARFGASVTIRMPDVFPSFPYVWRGDAFWFDAVDRIVEATVAAGPLNIYAYEIWNEPDWNWKPQWGDFDDIWARTYRAIRALDAEHAIMGPSISRWNPAWMRSFLEAAKASGTLPDIVSWHELDPRYAGDLALHVSDYRKMETDLAIGPLPISINEYASPRDMGVPGALVRFVARLERARVDTADLAFWHKPGRLSDLIAPKAGGRGPARDAEPTGAFWVYKWYGEMTGSMVAVTPEQTTGGGLDGFASFDPSTRVVRIVVGGEGGDHRVTVTGLEALGDAVTVEIYKTYWTGTDGGLPEPTALRQTTLSAVGDSVTISLHAADDGEAFLLVVTPSDAAAPFTPSPVAFSARYEAEDTERTAARVIRSNMAPGHLFANTVSNGAYVGLSGRPSTSLRFTISVPAASAYELSFGYSNGLADTAHYLLAVNGGEPAALALTPTQFRELIDQSKTVVQLPAGTSVVTLSAGPDSPNIPALPSQVEIDYLDVTAVD